MQYSRIFHFDVLSLMIGGDCAVPRGNRRLSAGCCQAFPLVAGEKNRHELGLVSQRTHGERLLDSTVIIELQKSKKKINILSIKLPMLFSSLLLSN